jgi:hypothetical protein
MTTSETDDRPFLSRLMRVLEGAQPAMTYDAQAQLNRLADGRPAARVIDLKTVAIVAED